MRAMWLRPWSREERAAVPADPPPPSGPSSRSAPEAAGWGRPRVGPTPNRRRRRLDEWARTEGVPGPPADRIVDRFARLDRASVAVLGDPGAGRGIQNAV